MREKHVSKKAPGADLDPDLQCGNVIQTLLCVVNGKVEKVVIGGSTGLFMSDAQFKAFQNLLDQKLGARYTGVELDKMRQWVKSNVLQPPPKPFTVRKDHDQWKQTMSRTHGTNNSKPVSDLYITGRGVCALEDTLYKLSMNGFNSKNGVLIGGEWAMRKDIYDRHTSSHTNFMHSCNTCFQSSSLHGHDSVGGSGTLKSFKFIPSTQKSGPLPKGKEIYETY
jgi:hypothetical protein